MPAGQRPVVRLCEALCDRGALPVVPTCRCRRVGMAALGQEGIDWNVVRYVYAVCISHSLSLHAAAIILSVIFRKYLDDILMRVQFI